MGAHDLSKHVIRVADWSDKPGARYRSHGAWSGEEFRDEHLIPAFEYAVAEEAMLLVDLDGVYGYAAGFLEEVFGGLARKFGPDLVYETLHYKTVEEPYLEEEIRKYVAEARNTRAAR